MGGERRSRRKGEGRREKGEREEGGRKDGERRREGEGRKEERAKKEESKVRDRNGRWGEKSENIHFLFEYKTSTHTHSPSLWAAAARRGSD